MEYDASTMSPFANMRSLSAKATGDAHEPLLRAPPSATHSRRWAEVGEAGAAEEARPLAREVVQALALTQALSVHSA